MTLLTQPRLRLLLLLAGIVAIVVVPLLVRRVFNQRLYDSAQWVSHTYQVESTANGSLKQIRDAESGALALALGRDTPAIRARLKTGLADARTGLARLQRLTRDNPDQQERIGALRARVDDYLQIVTRVSMSSDPAERRALAMQMIDRWKVDPPSNAIINAEQALAKSREAAMVRASNRLDTWSLGTSSVQLLMLVGLLLVWRHETDRRVRSGLESARANARADAMLQSVREPIALVDDGQRLVLANEAFVGLYGMDRDAVAGHPLADVGDGAWINPVFLQRLRDVASRGRELWDFELTQVTDDGVARHMVVNAVRMQGQDGSGPGVLITASDLTAHKASEEQVRELNRQLEGKVGQVSEVNRELEAFSYSVSHDLRAPLRHIAGFAEKLERHLGDAADDKSRHYLGIIGGSAQRMGALIDDLLVYSRLGRNAIRLQAVDMQSLVAELRAMFDATRANDQPDAPPIEWHVAPLPVVVADENMLRQAWQNLIGNAVKYSGQRTPPVIHVGYERAADGAHHFTVRDNGAGFDMAYASKLFGVFQRLHKASEYPGTGIGLASVRRVITRHDGQVWAEAQPDQGATFHFTLPAMLDAPSTRPAGTPA